MILSPHPDTWSCRSPSESEGSLAIGRNTALNEDRITHLGVQSPSESEGSLAIGTNIALNAVNYLKVHYCGNNSKG